MSEGAESNEEFEEDFEEDFEEEESSEVDSSVKHQRSQDSPQKIADSASSTPISSRSEPVETAQVATQQGLPSRGNVPEAFTSASKEAVRNDSGVDSCSHSADDPQVALVTSVGRQPVAAGAISSPASTSLKQLDDDLARLSDGFETIRRQRAERVQQGEFADAFESAIQPSIEPRVGVANTAAREASRGVAGTISTPSVAGSLTQLDSDMADLSNGFEAIKQQRAMRAAEQGGAEQQDATPRDASDHWSRNGGSVDRQPTLHTGVTGPLQRLDGDLAELGQSLTEFRKQREDRVHEQDRAGTSVVAKRTGGDSRSRSGSARRGPSKERPEPSVPPIAVARIQSLDTEIAKLNRELAEVRRNRIERVLDLEKFNEKEEQRTQKEEQRKQRIAAKAEQERRRTEAAIQLQSHARGHRVRCFMRRSLLVSREKHELERSRIELNDSLAGLAQTVRGMWFGEEDRLKAAVYIQAWWRSTLAWRVFTVVQIHKSELHVVKRMISAASCIQSATRLVQRKGRLRNAGDSSGNGTQIGAALSGSKVADTMMELVQLAHAATFIQSVHRGNKSRRNAVNQNRRRSSSKSQQRKRKAMTASELVGVGDCEDSAVINKVAAFARTLFSVPLSFGEDTAGSSYQPSDSKSDSLDAAQQAANRLASMFASEQKVVPWLFRCGQKDWCLEPSSDYSQVASQLFDG